MNCLGLRLSAPDSILFSSDFQELYDHTLTPHTENLLHGNHTNPWNRPAGGVQFTDEGPRSEDDDGAIN